jgi:hypothetical protein
LLFLGRVTTIWTWEDDVKLARFEDEYGMETYVNPDQVTHIRAIGESTVIHFGSDKHTVTVKMAASAVASQLVDAGTSSEELVASGGSARTSR